MTTEELIKYVVWIVFFILAAGGIYLLFRNLGVIG
jgi:hypothetical protein